MSWPKVKIGDLVESVSKWNPKVNPSAPSFTYIDLSSIDKEKKLIHEVTIVLPNEAPSRARQLVQGNDILVSTVRPNLNGVAMVDPEYDGATASTGYCVLRPNPEKIIPSFLFHWVKTPHFISEMTRNSTGANYPAVSDKTVKEHLISLPPLDEQKRIAAILDLVDDTEISINIIHNSKQQLIRSTFLEMFGDMLTNPMNWPVMKLGEVCESQLGKAISNEAKLCKAPSKYLRNANVKWRKIEFHDLKEMDFKDSEKHKLTLHDGDVLATEGGNVGRCAIWKYGNQNIYFQNSLHRIRVNLDVLTPEYLVEYFSIMSERGGLIRETIQVTIAHLTGHKLKKLPLPLPPLVLQQKFIRILKQIQILSEENLTQFQNLNLSLKQEILT